MKFRTELTPKELKEKVDHSSSILSLGSCFAVNIGSKLLQSGFSVSNNPLGTIFNPISLFHLIEKTYNQELLDEKLFLNQNNSWLHHNLHSQFKTNSKEEFQTLFEELSTKVANEIKNSTHVILTLGTAFSYELNDSKKTVSNCHKVPQSNFKKHLLNPQEIIDSYNQIAPILKGKTVILTLSPIRHTKDGIEENSISKATLRIALNEINKTHPNTHYFPAYELLMDDLRDYRFYDKDLVHPNEIGIQYVWEKFKSTAVTSHTLELMDEVQKIKQAIDHKPFSPLSDSHLTFLTKTLSKAKNISSQVNLNLEIEELERRINEFR